MLDCFLAEAELRVYRRKHVLPIFWIPVPKHREPDAAYQARQPQLRRQLAEALLELGDPDDCVSTSSVINGEFDVLRRFRRGQRLANPTVDQKHRILSRAHYLIIPAKPADALSSRSPANHEAYQEQEDRTAEIITQLTDLEARGASYLHDVHRDLQIWHGHLDVYDAVVERGAFLWDGLSTHLVGRRRTVRRVHRAVELLHQLLLQGIGDMAHLTNRTRDCVARIEEAADQLRTDYDDQLTEHHRGQDSGLRGALARVGLFEKVTQHGHQTLQEANRVKAIYDELLRSVGYAFDEWRVRESDLLQRLSAGLGAFLALIGIVTVLDATVNLKPTTAGEGQNATADATIFGLDILRTSGVITSWLVGGALVIVVGGLLVVWGLSGRLGSRRFRRAYTGRWHRGRRRGGVWRLLKDMSTDELQGRTREFGHDREAWAKHDDELARRFADLWDQATATDSTGRRDNLRKDISAQTRRIEQWGLHALLLTERARQMHQYRLPKLTCMYRGCARLPGSFLTGPDGASDEADRFPMARQPEPPAMVGFTEFTLCLAHAGLTWKQAYELDLWLRNRRPQTAHHLLELITSAGVAATTTPKQATASLTDRVKPDLDHDDLARYPADFDQDMRRYLEREGFTDLTEPDANLCVTARKKGKTYRINQCLDHAPTIRDLAPLVRHRLRHPGHAAMLATTATTGRRTAILACLAGIRIRSTRWLYPGSR